jgi:hypothetical protein
MTKNAEPQLPKERRLSVYVVETWMRNPGKWWPMDSRVSRGSAWAQAREFRKKWPDESFRVTKYVSVKS